jgi:hypothetical protein
MRFQQQDVGLPTEVGLQQQEEWDFYNKRSGVPTARMSSNNNIWGSTTR